MASPRTAIVGLGSVLMGDDGIGPYFARRFEAAWRFPEGVSVEDLGTPGPELANYLSGLRALLVIDAVRQAGEPGELRVYRKQQLLRHDASAGRSAHDPGLNSALLAAELIGNAPDEVTLIGVIPARIELHAGLSSTVITAMPEVELAVLGELESWGIVPERRTEPRTPDFWWLDAGSANRQPNGPK